MDFLSEHIEQTNRERSLSEHQLKELIMALDANRRTAPKNVANFTIAGKSSRILRAVLQRLRRQEFTVVRLYYRQILEREGYRVEEAINGLEGLEKAVQTLFDLCIVDVNMPMMDGYTFLHALRREPVTHAVPALMTTSEAGPEDHRTALGAGANAYLVKPVARDQLALYVGALLGRSVA